MRESKKRGREGGWEKERKERRREEREGGRKGKRKEGREEGSRAVGKGITSLTPLGEECVPIVFFFSSLILEYCLHNKPTKNKTKQKEEEIHKTQTAGTAESRCYRCGESAGQKGDLIGVSKGYFVYTTRHSWFKVWGFVFFSLALTGCLNLANKQFENDWGKKIFLLKPGFPNCPIN